MGTGIPSAQTIRQRDQKARAENISRNYKERQDRLRGFYECNKKEIKLQFNLLGETSVFPREGIRIELKCKKGDLVLTKDKGIIKEDLNKLISELKESGYRIELQEPACSSRYGPNYMLLIIRI